MHRDRNNSIFCCAQLIAVLCVVMNSMAYGDPSRCLAPKTFASKDRDKAHMQARMDLEKLLERYKERYGDQGNQPSQKILTDISEAAKRYWDADSVLAHPYIAKDGKNWAVVLTVASRFRKTQIILGTLKPNSKLDSKILGRPISSVPAGLQEKIGSYYMRTHAFESWLSLNRRTFLEWGSKLSIAAGIAWIARRYWPTLLDYFQPQRNLADVYLVTGSHFDTPEQTDWDHVQKQVEDIEKILKSVPLTSERKPNALFVMEMVPNNIRVFNRFVNEFPEHGDLLTLVTSLQEGPLDKAVEASLELSYRRELEHETRLILKNFELLGPPSEYKNHYSYMLAIAKAKGMRLALEQVSFQNFLMLARKDLAKDQLFRKNDFPGFRVAWENNFDEELRSALGRDKDLKKLFQKLLHENPGVVLISLRGAAHEVNRSVFENQGFRFSSHSIRLAEETSSEEKLQYEWERLRSSPDNVRKKAIIRCIAQSRLESVLCRELNNRTLSLQLARKSIEALESQVDLENWLKVLFDRCETEKDFYQRILEDVVKRGILKRRERVPGIPHIGMGGLLQWVNEHPLSNEIPSPSSPLVHAA